LPFYFVHRNLVVRALGPAPLLSTKNADLKKGKNYPFADLASLKNQLQKFHEIWNDKPTRFSGGLLTLSSLTREVHRRKERKRAF
jgi:hypothetical protein